MDFRITVLGGDGIGPEVTEQAVRVLKKVSRRTGSDFYFDCRDFGGAAIDSTGEPFPEAARSAVLSSDAVLLGAVGGKKWEGGIRPEAGLLQLRKTAGAYINLRPVRTYPFLDFSVLKAGRTTVDLIVVRELIGGIYFGKSGTAPDGLSAFDTEEYSVSEIARIARAAFELAAARTGRLCSVDKANVLESSRLWRKTVCETAREFPNVELSHLYADNAAMQLIAAPERFDIILTNNIFGDILSDEASMLSGSLGLLPSASLGGRVGIFEPIHGSAPDIAGKGTANPYGAILSAAMLLRYSLKMPAAADAVENAVGNAISNVRTPDIGGSAATTEAGDAVLEYL